MQQGSHCKQGILWEYWSSCFGEPGSGSYPSWQSAASLKKSFLLLNYWTIHRNVVYLRSVELQFILAVSKSDTHSLETCMCGCLTWKQWKNKTTQTKKTYLHHQAGVQKWIQQVKNIVHGGWSQNLPTSSVALCWHPCTKLAFSGHSWRTATAQLSLNFGLYIQEKVKSSLSVGYIWIWKSCLVEQPPERNWRKTINTLTPLHFMEPKRLQGSIWYLWHLAEKWCKQILKWRWGNFKWNVSLIATPWQSNWMCSPFYKTLPKIIWKFHTPIQRQLSRNGVQGLTSFPQGQAYRIWKTRIQTVGLLGIKYQVSWSLEAFLIF